MKAKVARQLLKERERLREREREAAEEAVRAEQSFKEADANAAACHGAASMNHEAIRNARQLLRTLESEAPRLEEQATEALRGSAHRARDLERARARAAVLAAKLADPRFAQAEARVAEAEARRLASGQAVGVSAPLAPESVEGLRWLKRVFSAPLRGSSDPVECDVLEREEREAAEAEGLEDDRG